MIHHVLRLPAISCTLNLTLIFAFGVIVVEQKFHQLLYVAEDRVIPVLYSHVVSLIPAHISDMFALIVIVPL